MFRLFIDGGVFWMSLLTLELIGLLLAAWKAPGWVKEAGLLALITGVLYFLIGFYQVAMAVQMIAGPVSSPILFAGFRVASIGLTYGCMIYAVSLIIRIIQKPKLL